MDAKLRVILTTIFALLALGLVACGGPQQQGETNGVTGEGGAGDECPEGTVKRAATADDKAKAAVDGMTDECIALDDPSGDPNPGPGDSPGDAGDPLPNPDPEPSSPDDPETPGDGGTPDPPSPEG